MSATYFAYGSNMASRRLIERVPSARAVGAAELSGYRFQMNKRGRDGSAKANICIAPGERVWGVAFRLAIEEFEVLDRFEGGYERAVVSIRVAGQETSATTYICGARRHWIENPATFSWYRRLMLEGAAEHALPDEYRAMLAGLGVLPDSD